MISKVLSRFIAHSAIRRFAIALFCATAVAGAIAQAPFDSAFERQLWKTLLPMGGDLAIAGVDFVPVPRRVSVNTPSPVKVFSWTDETGTDLYRSQTDPSSMPGATQEERAQNAYNAEVDLLRDNNGSLAGNEGACTFSHRDDWDGDGPQWRQCVSGGLMLPPPPGALFDPVGLAVDGTTVYVVDDMNQRVQAFDFQGRVKPMKYPIGNGVPGSGTYSYPNYLPYAGFPGYAEFDGGYSGSQLKAPNGIAVDAAHQIVVADTGNFRIAVFANDGSPVLTFPLPEQLGNQMKPTLVAVTPGATVTSPGTAIPAGHENDRIVVTDWSHCMVQIYKPNFELVKTLPEALPAPQLHDGCKNGDPSPQYPLGTPTFDGEFSTVTGVTIDQAGHIYVTDHAQNVVQVFDVNGNTLGWIGKPGVQPAPGEISGPVGVAIDHLGRVGVIDAGNSRVVFYKVTFAPVTNAPTATFEFQLDTVVSVGDFPMALAEQVGSVADGLDPKGRFVATDPWFKQILRFELPELAIADAQASILEVQPVGQPANQLTGRGTFKVAVPRQKDSAVIDVETFVVPVEAGVTVVPGSLIPGNDEVPSIDIAPGEYVAYEFTYTTGPNVMQATFAITARGDFDGTTYLSEAPEASARSRAPCAACDATHAIHWLDQDTTPGLAEPTTNPATGEWYPAGVFVRLLPVPADGSISHIGWYYDGASEIFYPQHGQTRESALGSAGFIDVPVGVAGATSLTYWAITTEGSMGDPHTVVLNLDLTPPSANFLLWPPYTGTTDVDGRSWFNHDVTVGYVAKDIYSGTEQDTEPNPAIADGQLFFTAEGRDQSQDVTLTDRAGHEATFNSAFASGGGPVNIDKVAPDFDALPVNPIELTVNGEDAQGSFATVHPDAFKLTATDPDLSNNEPGSGVASLSNPGGQVFRFGVVNQWTYTAVDHAGNSRSITVDVTVVQAPASVGAPDQFVGYGGELILRANVTPRTATGTVSFVFGPYVRTVLVQTVTGGVDPATGVTRVQGEAVAVIPQVLANVGVYPLHVEFSGNQLNETATYDLATVTVQPRTITIVADAQQKYFGDPDPELTFRHNPLVGSDPLTVELFRQPGTAVGLYSILPQSIVVGSNYNSVYQGATMTIFGRVAVTPRPQTKTYGDADPLFTFDLSPLPEGGVISTSPVCDVAAAVPQFGSHTIACGGGFGNFLQFTYNTAQLTVAQRPATIAAQSTSRPYGAANPSFTAVAGNVVAGETLNYNLSSPAVAASPIGPYDIDVNLLSNPNYSITTTKGTLTVTPKPITVTATAVSKVYGSSDPSPLPYTVSGSLVIGDTFSGSLSRAAGSNVGSYAINKGTLALSANYALTFQGANLTITQKAATVTAQDKSKIFGQADPPLTATGSGFFSSDNITFAATRAPGSAVGTYAITPTASGVALPNYNVTYVNGVFTIITNNRPPVCTAAYGGEIWPPNHKKFYAAPIKGVVDPEGQALTFLITGIWQDEPIDSTGDGKFSPDGQGVGTPSAWVRAERNGHQNSAVGNGRIYEILFTATDNNGGSCKGSVIWTVPHDRGQGSTAIDSGVRYDSTGVVPGARNKSQIHQKSPTP